jgi:hypothetical protein
MAKERILITVKTYPTLSVSYEELVCTAGIREDGSWVRIYPMPFRKLNYSQQYKKYDWIELDITKRKKDFRPESYRPQNHDFEILGHIGTKDGWRERKELILQNVYYDMGLLIADSYDPQKRVSLAVFKPRRILDFVWEAEESREWPKDKLARFNQMNLFEKVNDKFEVVRKLPYKFFYIFESDDGKRRRMMIEDWETGILFWKCLEKYQSEEIACEKVKEKYLDQFTKEIDLHFFVGTTLTFHARNANIRLHC